MKKIRVILSSDAKEVYNHLKEEAPKSKTERTILNAITKKIEIIAFVLDLIDHPTYNKKFGYKRK